MSVGNQNSGLIISQKKDYIQVDEQGLPPLYPSDTKPVNDLRINQGTKMSGSDSMPPSFLVKTLYKFCISTILCKCNTFFQTTTLLFTMNIQQC